MSYFKTSYATLQALAQHGSYEDVAGFLVLARHASGLRHAGYEPYKLSGAGINGIHEKAGLSEEQARGVIERLRQHGVIRPVSAETRRAFHHARWEIVQGPLDLDLPHALVDSGKAGAADSALKRLRRHRTVEPHLAEHLANVSDTELRLDALMLLLSLYRSTSMCTHGGVAPYRIWREWDVLSKTPREGGVRWGAEPVDVSACEYFMAEALPHIPCGKTGLAEDRHQYRFWNAWAVIQSTGLVYEAVCRYDTMPGDNPHARLLHTVRVNDFHAGAIAKTGDPSLLRTMENASGARLGFYTPAGNARGDREALWVMLPDDRGALWGVWRLRFRASNPDTGAWFEQENEAIDTVFRQVEGAALAAA